MKGLLAIRLLRVGPLAQLVEQLTLNQRVAGSSPSGITILKTSHVRNDVAFFMPPLSGLHFFGLGNVQTLHFLFLKKCKWLSFDDKQRKD